MVVLGYEAALLGILLWCLGRWAQIALTVPFFGAAGFR